MSLLVILSFWFSARKCKFVDLFRGVRVHADSDLDRGLFAQRQQEFWTCSSDVISFIFLHLLPT
jgi:hypothetical protein